MGKLRISKNSFCQARCRASAMQLAIAGRVFAGAGSRSRALLSSNTFNLFVENPGCMLSDKLCKVYYTVL